MRHRAMQVAPKARNAPEPGPSGSSIFAGVAGSSASFRWHGERMHYRCAGDGPSIVLVHAPDIGGCCVEWRRNIDSLAAHHTVFAVDLPGYGLSEIQPRAYTAETYIQFLGDFIRVLGGPGTTAIGCHLSASYLVHAAIRWPTLIDKLVLVAPTGLSTHRRPLLGSSTFQMLKLPGLSNALYGSTTTRFGILEHLQEGIYENETHAGPHAVDTRYFVCHRPNADYTERSRQAGLQNIEIRDQLRRLRQPTMLAWGRFATSPPLSEAEEFKRLCRSAELTVFEHSAIAVHEEESVRFNQMALRFIDAPSPVAVL